MSDVAIRVHNIRKTFQLPHEKKSSVKGVFLNSLRPRKFEKQQVLKEINFEVKKGDFFGIVGRNGSGKSTLLKLIAGVYVPDKGKIAVKGKLVPFIELGVGFNPELTGRENVYLNGALLGISRDQMDLIYDDIVDFAELQRFMDQKLNNYSSGMQVRLAFSIAIRAEGDILLLDEVLAVGDTLFQQKCFNYFQTLKQNNKTVVLVSHDQNALRQFCTNGVLIENGRIITEGKIDEVLDSYIDIISENDKQHRRSKSVSTKERHGTGKVDVKRLILSNSDKGSKHIFDDDDKFIEVEIEFVSITSVESPIYGIIIKDAFGNSIFSSNNQRISKQSFNLKPNNIQRVVWKIPNIFSTGEYYISPAAADKFGSETYVWINSMRSFKVVKKMSTTSLTCPDHSIEIKEPEVD